MSAPVVIKGTKSGIIIVLDKDMPFAELIKHVEEKFKDSSDFLGSMQVAVSFEGRKCSDDEELELVDCISKNTNLDIVCIVDNDEKREEYFNKALNEKLVSMESNTGQFYKGNLRSGQVLEFQSSIVILGDVNVGAQVISTGNVVILGALRGNVYAGASGNEDSFVVALKMNPTQIRISDTIARAPDQGHKEDETTQIAYLEDGNIYIEPLTRNTLGDIRL